MIKIDFEKDLFMPIVISAMFREKTREKWGISGDAFKLHV